MIDLEKQKAVHEAFFKNGLYHDKLRFVCVRHIIYTSVSVYDTCHALQKLHVF